MSAFVPQRTIADTLDIRTYHKFAIGYLNSKGKMGQRSIAGPDIRARYVESAVADLSKSISSPVLNYPTNFLCEELKWLAAHGVREREHYLSVARTGRVTALNAAQREVVWKIKEHYWAAREKRNFLYDYDDIAMFVSDELSKDTSERFYRHVVVDEGQVLSPEMVRSLSKAVPKNGSLTFFGDVAQHTYGKRVSWRDALLDTDFQIWKFRHNYRNTAQIAAVAKEIARMPFFTADEDLVSPAPSSAAGPLPIIVHCASEADELDFIVQQASEFAKTQSVGILCNSSQQIALLQSKLRGLKVIDRHLDGWVLQSQTYTGTYEMARGLEFDTVILPFVSKSNLPPYDDVVELGINNAENKWGHYFYIAVTRAKRNLILSYTGKAFTELCPKAAGLFQRMTWSK